MAIARLVLSIYRKLQYKICGRSEYGIMPVGELCSHTPFEENVNHGDVVHPCVRYIPESYLGHKWWMVYTPYYAANDKTENPILCYGKTDDEIPPTEWVVAYQVQGQPVKGYNSDPTLFYDDGKMYVMWRENLTQRCDNAGFVRATFGAEVKEKGIGNVFGPLVGTNDFEEDNEVSPTFVKLKDGNYRCYAMHLRFHSRFIRNSHPMLRKHLGVVANVLDLLGLWSQQKGYGYAIWDGTDITKPFVYQNTMKFKNCNMLYRPWHMDLFKCKNKLYAIVQTNQCNADICLAGSDNGIVFYMYDKPLMTNRSCHKLGIYKPTGGVKNDNLYLYYTAQDPECRSLNKLYCTSIKFSNILTS